MVYGRGPESPICTWVAPRCSFPHCLGGGGVQGLGEEGGVEVWGTGSEGND